MPVLCYFLDVVFANRPIQRFWWALLSPRLAAAVQTTRLHKDCTGTDLFKTSI